MGNRWGNGVWILVETWRIHGMNKGGYQEKREDPVEMTPQHTLLVGGLEHLDYFIHILGINIPTDLLYIFQMGRYTTNQDSVAARIHGTVPTCPHEIHRQR